LPILQGRFSKSARIAGNPQFLKMQTIHDSKGISIMATHKLLLLPGDGIGTEVMAEVTRVIDWFGKRGIAKFETEQGLVGGSSYDADKVAITDATMARAQAADAVIFGAVGGPKWADVPYEARPEAGLLRLRKDMALFANLRPAICYPALA
jgi:3-isopropylmalate dehydrogenase